MFVLVAFLALAGVGWAMVEEENVNITNPEKGTVTITLNGSEVVAGASVTKEDKLIVTYVATAANYKASATIAGNAYSSGAEYIVPESGNVDVSVSFILNNPGPGPDPSTVDVTGVTLEPASQTLSVNETLALVSDMTGRVIWQGKLSEKKQMAVSAGVYIVRLSNTNGVQTQKVIVQ